ncbi:hypothetical protein E1298_15830 [Actinomadura rubrisoli]|uniref:PPM-type phosphatase domain-containing protein n=1 Tax=Actinomadura rubrisoli TaxID=2530368 RepID=A0A4R5BQC2_9ACTN|nr:hypothetical protein E1298_15830 [Actinomadura rubrisoli]
MLGSSLAAASLCLDPSEERLIATIERVGPASATVQQMVRNLSHTLMRERGGITSDDATLFLIEWRGGTADHLTRPVTARCRVGRRRQVSKWIGALGLHRPRAAIRGRSRPSDDPPAAAETLPA